MKVTISPSEDQSDQKFPYYSVTVERHCPSAAPMTPEIKLQAYRGRMRLLVQLFRDGVKINEER